jgi:aerobic carbon-monoxide dehydrogenase medium subunit
MAMFDLAEPRTLDETLSLLDQGDPAVRPIGGGTALMLMIKAQIFKPTRLVSLRHLGAPFSGFSLSADSAYLRVGAMTTFAELEHSPLVKMHLPVVVRTMQTLANVRVRNVATVGGNLAHGDPHLDLPPVWMVLAAEARILSKAGERAVPVEDIFAGYYETTIADGELIAELRVPIRPTWRSTYVKVTTRAIHDWPALGIALSAEFAGERINDLRIVLSAALDKPTRLVAAEQVLRGQMVDRATLDRAGDAAVAEVDMATDSRGSAAYKNHLLRVHLARAIQSIAGA